EAVIDRDVPGQGIENPLLRFDGENRPPTGHRLGPFDRMDPDIGATIDREDAVAKMLTPHSQEARYQCDSLAGVGRRFKDIVTDAKSHPVFGNVTVEAIDDQRATFRSGEDKRDRSGGMTHPGVPTANARHTDHAGQHWPRQFCWRPHTLCSRRLDGLSPFARYFPAA